RFLPMHPFIKTACRKSCLIKAYACPPAPIWQRKILIVLCRKSGNYSENNGNQTTDIYICKNMARLLSRFTYLLKPILYRIAGPKGYKRLQAAAMKRNIRIKGTEEPEMELLPDFISPADQVIDVGANFIYYTERLSRLVPDGQVF